MEAINDAYEDTVIEDENAMPELAEPSGMQALWLQRLVVGISSLLGKARHQQDQLNKVVTTM